MQLILLENIKNLGQIGDLVNVKRGYGRNFLVKYGKALKASKENIDLVNKKKAELNEKNLELKKKAKKIYNNIDQKKYKLMHKLFKRTGKHGPWMMRNTTSIQINIDILSKTDAEVPTMDHRGLINVNGSWSTIGGMLGVQHVTSKVIPHFSTLAEVSCLSKSQASSDVSKQGSDGQADEVVKTASNSKCQYKNDINGEK